VVALDDDPPADIEPETGALADRLGGVEGLEDVGGGLWDAGTVVADLDQDPVAVAGGAHGQTAAHEVAVVATAGDVVPQPAPELGVEVGQAG
jgi:hypothetical protein